jgi:hypothetical protein
MDPRNQRDQSSACSLSGYETPRMMVCVRPFAIPPEMHVDGNQELATGPEIAPPASDGRAINARESYADLREEFLADRDSDPRSEREST